jgi:hypothetical protein
MPFLRFLFFQLHLLFPGLFLFFPLLYHLIIVGKVPTDCFLQGYALYILIFHSVPVLLPWVLRQ